MGRLLTVYYILPMESNPFAGTNYRASDDFAGSSVTNFNLQASSQDEKGINPKPHELVLGEAALWGTYRRRPRRKRKRNEQLLYFVLCTL